MIKLSTILLVVAATAATAATAEARDSTWLLCKGAGTQGDTKTMIVASLLEHRGAADRDLGTTVIYGDHVTHGAIVGKAAAPFIGKPTALTLNNVSGKRGVAFTGTATLGNDMKSFVLKGSIDATFGDDPKAKSVPFAATLTCEELDDPQ